MGVDGTGSVSDVQREGEMQLCEFCPESGLHFPCCSENWYKDHPSFQALYHDEDGDGKKDFGKRRIFDQVNVNRKANR
jgi:hypothetical protein